MFAHLLYLTLTGRNAIMKIAIMFKNGTIINKGNKNPTRAIVCVLSPPGFIIIPKRLRLVS